MSNLRRLGVVLTALVLAVAAFFVLRPDDTATRQDKTAQEQRAEQSKPSADQPDAPTPEQPDAAPELIRIADGRPVGGVETVTFASGEQVRLAFRSDSAGEVHIHGYDRYVKVRPGRTARVRFPADSEGSFEIEDHGSGELLARLEVEP